MARARLKETKYKPKREQKSLRSIGNIKAGDLLLESEAANLLRVRPSTMRSWRYRRKGPHYVMMNGRNIMYLRKDLQIFLQRVDPSNRDAPDVVEVGKRQYVKGSDGKLRSHPKGEAMVEELQVDKSDLQAMSDQELEEELRRLRGES